MLPFPALNSAVRRFQWVGVDPGDLQRITESQRDTLEVQSPRTQYFLKVTSLDISLWRGCHLGYPAAMGINSLSGTSVVFQIQILYCITNTLPDGTKPLDEPVLTYDCVCCCVLQFGQEELPGLPLFITSQMKSTVFFLLAHPQLTVRENATKAFSSYLSRCEFKVGVGGQLER